MSDKTLEVWQMAREMVIDIHRMSLEILHETGSLSDQNLFDSLSKRLDTLGRKLNNYIQAVERQHNT